MSNSTDAFTQNRKLGRGVNIIGYDQGLWSGDDGRFQDKHFRLIKGAGFNIVTVHYYHPMDFTHQGAPWSSHKDSIGAEWRGTSGEQQRIIDDQGGVQSWAEQANRPIFLGEFGAYDKADMASRARYTDFMARQAEKLNWSWAYWQFDSDFVVNDIENDRWVTPIINALIPKEA